jgi:phage shock protein A
LVETSGKELQMSVFSRLFKIGQAGADKVLDRIEKPELMLDQAIRDKGEQIRDLKQAVLKCIATERKTKVLLEQEKAEAADWELKAEAALHAGKEALAVKALARATEHESKASELQGHWESQRTQVGELKMDITKMEDELAEFKRNKEFVLAQSRAADVKKKMYEAKAKMTKDSSADDLMARIKAKAERTSYEAAAAKEMAESFGGEDSLEKEFEGLGGSISSSAVQDKLAALKERVGKA